MTFPIDIKAEELVNYLGQDAISLSFCGAHKRNAYQDILEIADSNSSKTKVAVCRNGIYDLLPEAMFHPVDRFDNLMGSTYAEEFHDEYARELQEEENARRFFEPFDQALFSIGCLIDQAKNRNYSDASPLIDIICDTMPARFRDNRFVKSALPFVPMSHRIRGDKFLISTMLRKILFDEGITLNGKYETAECFDPEPRYRASLTDSDEDLYLGSVYPEDVLTFRIPYWNEEACDEKFLDFLNDIEIFAEFCNDYFMGIGTELRFDIGATSLPVRLSDEIYYNYLNYNTNL